MNEHKELELLESAWRAESPALPVDLERMVRRQGLWMMLNTAIGLLNAAAFLTASLAWAIRHPEPEWIVLAVGIWIVTVATVIYSLANRAGTWSPEAHDTRAFLAVSLKRSRAGLQAIRFGFYLLAVEVVLLAAWHTWYWSRRGPVPPITNWLIAGCLPLVFLVTLWTLYRYRRRELSRLEALEHRLID
jgi:hypothetical protein